MKKIFLYGILIFAIASCKKNDPNEAGNLVAKTVDDDPTVPCVTLSNTKLHVQSFGNADSTKLFILEGGPGNDFRYLLDMNNTVADWSLPQHYHVIFHDYRGSGLSRRHPINELNIAVLLKDFEELVDKYAPNQEIIIIGHSHGGLLAAQYVNAHPDRVKGLVFMEPGAFSRAINDKTINVNKVDFFGEEVNTILWLKQMVGANDHNLAYYNFGLIAANYHSPIRGEDCGAKSFRFGLACNLAISFDEVNNGQYDYTTNLMNYTKKVLFISTDQSLDIGYDFQEAHHVHLFPNVQHIKETGTGHVGMVNCRIDETLGYIKTYVQGL
jgi:proline iminopeptidase